MVTVNHYRECGSSLVPKKKEELEVESVTVGIA